MKINVSKIKPQYLWMYEFVEKHVFDYIIHYMQSQHKEGFTMMEIGEFVKVSPTTVFNLIHGNIKCINLSLYTFDKLAKFYLNDNGSPEPQYSSVPHETKLIKEIRKIPARELNQLVANTGLPRHYLSRFKRTGGSILLLGACILQDALNERKGLYNE